MSRDSFHDDKLPPWLRGVPLPPRPRSLDAPRAPAAEGTPPASSEPAPSWLSALSEQRPAPPPAAELPPWLRDEPDEAAAGATQDQSELPDWLRSIQGNQPASPSSQPASFAPETPAAGEALPDWLSDAAAAPEPAGTGSEAALPDWLRETPAASDATPSGGQAGELPDWLRETPATSDATAPGGQAGELPDWLRAAPNEEPPAAGEALPPWLSAPAAPPEPPAPAADDQTPDWLRSLAAETAGEFNPPPAAQEQPGDWSRTEEPEPGPSPYDTVEIPSWLRADDRAGEPDSPAPESDIPAKDDDITVEPFSFEGAATPLELPSWLADTSSGEAPRDELPSWLGNAGGDAERASGEVAQPSEVPSWLQHVGDDNAADTAAESPPAPPADVAPSWLHGAEQTSPPADQMPAWLRDEPAERPPPGETPAWLRDEQPPAEQPPALEAPQLPPPDDIPSWLRETPASEPAAPIEAAAEADTLPGATTPSEAQPGMYDDLPSWLRPVQPPASQGEVPPWLRDESGQPLPTAGAPGDAGLPAWLRGAPIEPEAPAPEQPPAPSPGPTIDLGWLDDAAAQPSATPAPGSDANGLMGGIELPAWLRPPEPPKEEISPADARSLDWLTRLGGQEEEETAAASSVTLPRLVPPAPPARTAAQIEALALLERLAANPFPDAAPAPAQAQPGVLRRFGAERLLYLALLAVALIALLVPAPAWSGLAAPATAAGASDLFAQIDQLGAGDVVLVAYEWDARRSGELRPLEQAVLGHLIQRQVKLVLVSTDPQGTLLQFDLRDRLVAAGYRGSGQDYILLGYRPGAELALRSLAQNFRGNLTSDFQGKDATEPGTLATDLATGQPRLNTLGDFSAILVLADDASDVQGWMEQIRPSARKADGAPVPIDFLLPAEAEPIAQPYLTLPGIERLAGKQGALAYQQLRGGADMSETQIASEASQQRLSLLAYLALAVAGAIGVGIAAAIGRRRA